MFYLGADGKRVYTLKKTAPDGTPTQSAHPGEWTALSRPPRTPRRVQPDTAPRRQVDHCRADVPATSSVQPVSRRTTSSRGSA